MKITFEISDKQFEQATHVLGMIFPEKYSKYKEWSKEIQSEEMVVDNELLNDMEKCVPVLKGLGTSIALVPLLTIEAQTELDE